MSLKIRIFAQNKYICLQLKKTSGFTCIYSNGGVLVLTAMVVGCKHAVDCEETTQI